MRRFHDELSMHATFQPSILARSTSRLAASTEGLFQSLTSALKREKVARGSVAKSAGWSSDLIFAETAAAQIRAADDGGPEEQHIVAFPH